MKAVINDNSICMTAGDQTIELFKLDTELLTNDLEHAAQVMNTMKEYEAALAAAKQKLADLQPKPKQRPQPWSIESNVSGKKKTSQH